MRRIVGDLVGGSGVLLICGGAYLLWGVGAALVSLGVPLVAAYVLRELGRR